MVLAIGIVFAGVAFATTRSDDTAVPRCDRPIPDPAAWARDDDARTGEARRIVACGTLDGLDRPAAERLLGAPGERDRRGIAYELGPDRLGIDSMWLALRFDGGVVVKAQVFAG